MTTDRRSLQILGLTGSSVLVLALGVVFLVLPQRAKVGSLHRSLEQTQAQIASIEATRGGAPAARATDIFQLSRAMPATDDMPGILLSLSRFTASTRTTLVSVRPGARLSLTDGSTALPLQVEVDGSYAGVARFLKLLRTSVRASGAGVRATARLFVVDTLAITANGAANGTAGSASGSTGEVEANIQLAAFDYGAPPSAVGATASSAAPSSTPAASSVSASPTPGGGG